MYQTVSTLFPFPPTISPFLPPPKTIAHIQAIILSNPISIYVYLSLYGLRLPATASPSAVQPQMLQNLDPYDRISLLSQLYCTVYSQLYCTSTLAALLPGAAWVHHYTTTLRPYHRFTTPRTAYFVLWSYTYTQPICMSYLAAYLPGGRLEHRLLIPSAPKTSPI